MRSFYFFYALDGCDSAGRFDDYVGEYYRGEPDAIEWVEELFRAVDLHDGWHFIHSAKYPDFTRICLRAQKLRRPNSGLLVEPDMTVSGGEPLFQPEFTTALLRAAKEAGLHNCLDTCGFASWEKLAAVLPYVDLFLYDLKETDPAHHLEYTGVPLEPILENLSRIDAEGGETILRCPLVPGLNCRDDHADGIAAVANRLAHLREINLMAYHPLGESKLARLGRKPGLGGDFASPAQLEPFRLRLEKACKVPVTFS